MPPRFRYMLSYRHASTRGRRRRQPLFMLKRHYKDIRTPLPRHLICYASVRGH